MNKDGVGTSVPQESDKNWTEVQAPKKDETKGAGNLFPREGEKSWTKVQAPKKDETNGAGNSFPREGDKNWTEVQAPNRKRFLNLPHIDMLGYYQFVTFRTYDSVDEFLKKLSDENIQTSKKQYKIDTYLDSSKNGCYLNGETLQYLKNFLLEKDKILYELIAFCIMPNHIHILFKQDMKLDKIMKSIKGASSNTINKLLDKKGKFWENSYYDKAIRDEKQFMITYEYIKNNPVKAGLSEDRFYGVYENKGAGTQSGACHWLECLLVPREGDKSWTEVQAPLKTPVFILDMKKLEQNLQLMGELQDKSGVKILLALKGFALEESFSLMGRYLYGVSASSLNEVKLGFEKFSKEVHTYSPAYKDYEIDEMAVMSDTLIFNSLSQWDRFYERVKDKTSCGLRVNLEMDFDIPEHCDPSRKHSRFGVLSDDLKEFPKGMEGLHVHSLCSANSYELEELMQKLQDKFGDRLGQLKWINFGGGHALTCREYDKENFIKIIKDFRFKYPLVEIYIEPSQAVVHDSGVLVARVLDIVHNEIDIAILDISIEVHLTDIMLTKTPPLVESAKDEGYEYQLSGLSCSAGDILGNYKFKKKLHVGDKITFLNQMAYTMVKTTSFNQIEPASVAFK